MNNLDAEKRHSVSSILLCELSKNKGDEPAQVEASTTGDGRQSGSSPKIRLLFKVGRSTMDRVRTCFRMCACPLP